MILVTGATGFIGSQLLERLTAFGTIRCLVRPSSIHKIPTSPNIQVVTGDITSLLDVRSAMTGVDRVIHLASALRGSGDEHLRRVNVDGTRNLVETAKRQKVDHFIFTSSENALREDLTDPYASTKREAEDIVRRLEHSLILRPCFVVGDGDDHGLGRLTKIALGCPVVPLFMGLERHIQPLSIRDMVEYLCLGFEKRLTGSYVLAGAETMTLNDFIRRTCAAKGKRRLFIPLPYALWRLVASSAQLANLYGSRTYDISRTVKDFGHSPGPL